MEKNKVPGVIRKECRKGSDKFYLEILTQLEVKLYTVSSWKIRITSIGGEGDIKGKMDKIYS